MKRVLAICLALFLTLGLTLPAGATAYPDIPQNSALGQEVQRAVDLGLMNGYNAQRFGYSDSMTRIQFITVLQRMQPQDRLPHTDLLYLTPEMAVDGDALQARSPEFFQALNLAIQLDIVDRNVPFRPDDAITRGEMAEMLVRFLGLKGAAQLAEKQGQLPFTDVTERKGYISIAYDIGMTKGTSPTTFAPNATATRAQAAAMLLRIREKLDLSPDFTHGFYAISSYSQLNLAQKMDAVSAGWSRMRWDNNIALLATTSAGQNEYCIPSGYETVAQTLSDHHVPLHLSVYMSVADGAAKLLASPEGRRQAVEQIVQELKLSYKTLGRNPYSGVTIDFEGLRQPQSADFIAFLTDLSQQLHSMGKTLYVCVSPVLAQGPYYDGYDYAAIGQLADKVILMAYDYDTQDMSQFVGTEYHKTAATAPIDQLYWSLRCAVQKIDPGKLLLGFSCKNTAWSIDRDGKLLSAQSTHPDLKTVDKRLHQKDTVTGWSNLYQQSYALYNSEDGQRWFLWYQDGRSVRSALNAARLLGVSGVSLWRLGEIPASWSILQ